MSQIWASGVKATAIANIKTAINARIVAQGDGTKALNTESLVAWVRGQLAQMVTDGEATDAGFVSALDPSPIAYSLAGTINPAHWSARPDWPAWTATQNQTAAQLLAGVQAQQGVLKKLSEAIKTHYSDTQDRWYAAVKSFLDGILEPTITPGVDPLTENRVYVITFVTDRGEESAPSDASEVLTLDANDTVSITVPAAPAGRHITHFRIYRSNSNSSGSAAQYVPNPDDEDGWPIAGLTITDDKKAAELQEPLPSLIWDEPPADLQGLVGGANGGMAGFRGNEFCACVPYKGYAWPVAYRITTETPIVGLGASGQNYFVGTRGRPYIITGTDNSTLIPQKLEQEQACVARRSIVAMGAGFLYASPDGLCVASPSGVVVLTGPDRFNLFDRKAWQALSPASIFAAESEGNYVFHWDNGTDTGMYSLDLVNGRLITLTNEGSALYRDTVTDTLYVATGEQIKAIGAGDDARTGLWRSKLIVLPDEVNFSWVQADSEYEAPITVRTYQDGVLTDTTVLEDKEPQRLPDGLAREWEVEVESTARITSLTLASNTEELKTL
jgi:hypothetical protein